MKLIKSIFAAALVTSILAAGAFGAHGRNTHQVDKNEYEYETVQDVIDDVHNKGAVSGKLVKREVITLDEFKELRKEMREIDEELVDDGELTEEKAKAYAKVYDNIYLELDMDRGIVTKHTYRDGTEYYKYYSKYGYYHLLGDKGEVFFTRYE